MFKISIHALAVFTLTAGMAGAREADSQEKTMQAERGNKAKTTVVATAAKKPGQAARTEKAAASETLPEENLGLGCAAAK